MTIIIGVAAGALLILIIFIIVLCCCCRSCIIGCFVNMFVNWNLSGKEVSDYKALLSQEFLIPSLSWQM